MLTGTEPSKWLLEMFPRESSIRKAAGGDLRDEETMHGLAGSENSLRFVGLIGNYEGGLDEDSGPVTEKSPRFCLLGCLTWKLTVEMEEDELTGTFRAASEGKPRASLNIYRDSGVMSAGFTWTRGR